MRTAPRRRSAAGSALSQIRRGCKPERRSDHKQHGPQVPETELSAGSPKPIDRHRARPGAQWRSPEALLDEMKSERTVRSKVRRRVFARTLERTVRSLFITSRSASG